MTDETKNNFDEIKLNSFMDQIFNDLSEAMLQYLRKVSLDNPLNCLYEIKKTN